jgi:hypothetical protein
MHGFLHFQNTCLIKKNAWLITQLKLGNCTLPETWKLGFTSPRVNKHSKDSTHKQYTYASKYSTRKLDMCLGVVGNNIIDVSHRIDPSGEYIENLDQNKKNLDRRKNLDWVASHQVQILKNIPHVSKIFASKDSMHKQYYMPQNIPQVSKICTLDWSEII